MTSTGGGTTGCGWGGKTSVSLGVGTAPPSGPFAPGAGVVSAAFAGRTAAVMIPTVIVAATAVRVTQCLRQMPCPRQMRCLREVRSWRQPLCWRPLR